MYGRRRVRKTLLERAERARAQVEHRWDGAPHYVRIVPTDHSFPAAPDDCFPWVSLALVIDPDDRVLFVDHDDHPCPWELPGGTGERSETPAGTANRECREETGVAPTIEELVFTERLEFDSGEPVTAPVLQAVFAGRVDGPSACIRDDAVRTDSDVVAATWFDREAIPAEAQFSDRIRTYLSAL